MWYIINHGHIQTTTFVLNFQNFKTNIYIYRLLKFINILLNYYCLQNFKTGFNRTMLMLTSFNQLCIISSDNTVLVDKAGLYKFFLSAGLDNLIYI